MAEQIRARIRGSRGRRLRGARRRVFATLGSFGRDAAEPRDPAPALVADRTPADQVDVVTNAFGILQGLFLARIVLALISVGRTVPIAAAILALSDPLVAPFRIVAHVDPAPVAVPLLDVPALLALIAWTLVETVCLATICVRYQRRCAAERAPKSRIRAGSRVRAGGWAAGLAKSR